MSLFAAKSSQVTRAILIFDLDLERTHWWAELTNLTAWAYELEQLGLARTCKALMDRQAWNGACTSCGTAGRAQKEAFPFLEPAFHGLVRVRHIQRLTRSSWWVRDEFAAWFETEMTLFSGFWGWLSCHMIHMLSEFHSSYHQGL